VIPRGVIELESVEMTHHDISRIICCRAQQSVLRRQRLQTETLPPFPTSNQSDAAWLALIQRAAGIRGERRAVSAVAADLVVLEGIDGATVSREHTRAVVVDHSRTADKRDCA
jgi:hypothetical protein